MNKSVKQRTFASATIANHHNGALGFTGNFLDVRHLYYWALTSHFRFKRGCERSGRLATTTCAAVKAHQEQCSIEKQQQQRRLCSTPTCSKTSPWRRYKREKRVKEMGMKYSHRFLPRKTKQMCITQKTENSLFTYFFLREKKKSVFYKTLENRWFYKILSFGK